MMYENFLYHYMFLVGGEKYIFLDQGEKLDTGESDFLKKGQTHIYPYDESNPDGPKRTSGNYLNDLKEAVKEKKPINGVKGTCSLNRLKYFCPIRSTAIDYMHTLCEGVIKDMFNYWFEIGDFLGGHSLRNYMQEIGMV